MGQTIDALVEGGKASAAPPLGPALGPAGVNIGDVIAKINEKTKDFSGMQVPVKIIVDDDKSFEIKVGTPPTSAMIKRETKLDKLSGKPKSEKLADMKLQQVIKIAKNKLDDLNSTDAISSVKQVIGTCASGGIMIEGKDARVFMKEVESGKYDEMINTWQTDISEEELQQLEVERKELAKRADELHKQQQTKADSILKSMEGQARHKVVAAMEEAEIPHDLINKLLPSEKKEEK